MNKREFDAVTRQVCRGGVIRDAVYDVLVNGMRPSSAIKKHGIDVSQRLYNSLRRHREFHKEMKAAFGGVPDGFAIVPKKPTEAQRISFLSKQQHAYPFDQCYDALIKMAPDAK